MTAFDLPHRINPFSEDSPPDATVELFNEKWRNIQKNFEAIAAVEPSSAVDLNDSSKLASSAAVYALAQSVLNPSSSVDLNDSSKLASSAAVYALAQSVLNPSSSVDLNDSTKLASSAAVYALAQLILANDGAIQSINTRLVSDNSTLDTLQEVVDFIEQLKSTQDDLASSKISGSRTELVPPGAVQAFAMDTPPAGWLKCNGVYVRTDDYPELFNAIGTKFGNYSGHFRLPDLRGEFVRGWDDGRGTDRWLDDDDDVYISRNFGTFQSDAMQNITGNIEGISQTFAGHGTVSGVFGKSTFSAGGTPQGADTENAGAISFDVSRQVRTADETRPRNIALLYCIKT